MRLWVIVLLGLAPAVLRGQASDVEATSLLGKPLVRPALGAAVRALYEGHLVAARKAFEHTPTNADSIIWLGRRTAYLGRYAEAIKIYTEGVDRYPGDARMYRHRGHRYLSIRKFDPAVRDFEKAAELTRGVFLDRLERRLNNGLRLIQVREPGWDRDALAALAADVIARSRPKGARVLVNGDLAVAHRVGADGVHLTSAQLRTLGERPDFALVGASCHGVEDLRLASELAADFCVLGPVCATPGHPDSAPIGWDGFAALLEGVPLPVYALGGVTRGDLDAALEQGAQGVAMIRGAWSPA